ncbi:hypothetical protein [Geomonas subterranea]|uniref:hypothetical protein n=1 Tax=Geomonas subterranea TaxID=2847989 RepID=UPI001CD4D4E5|nr:hypothetical protein [Geomonas fuzhouensis]
MGRISSMGGFNSPEGTEAKKEAIKTTIAAISADIKDGIISEAVAFEILCSELSVITGIPVEAKQPTTIH